jgi:endopeptidase O
MSKKLLSKFNIKEEEIKKHIENAIKYDDLLSKYILSSEELAVYTNLYNLYSTTNLNKKINALNIQKIANEITNNSVDNISVISPVFLDNVNNLINDQNFPLFKSRMLISFIISLSNYLSNDLREISSEYSRYLRGIKQPLNKSKFEVDLTMQFYGMPFGLYYGKTYFGENAKKNVEQMVNNMINIYKSRLANNS